MRGPLAWLLAALLTITACSGDPPAPANPQLRVELMKMMDDDQRLTAEASQDQWSRVVSTSNARIKQIIDRYGWPGYALVGKDGAHAAWLLVQHADLDLDLQRRGLTLMQEAVDDGDADPSDLAYLIDRVRVAERKPQVYGTQWETTPEGAWRPRTPIEQEAEVDRRREEVGLKPLAEYLEELKSS